MIASTANTRWSLVQEAKGDTPQARAALRELCEIYYTPVHHQMRRWLRSEDEARDTTHAFFAHLLAGASLHAADEVKGRFRSYLFGAARHFWLQRQRSEFADMRGGRSDPVALDDAGAVPDDRLAPDAEFDRAWACALLKHTLDQLEAEMQADGRGEAFVVLKPWLAGDATHGDTRAAARQLNLSETAVRVHVSRLRKRLRGILEQALADTLAPGADAQQELRELMAALR